MAKTAGKIIAWVIVILLLVGAAFGYYKFFWVFSDGTKTGELNSLTYTGYIWKTYEGEMILSGYGANKEYKGALPWRGYERAIVDTIDNSEPVTEPNNRLPIESSAEQVFL